MSAKTQKKKDAYSSSGAPGSTARKSAQCSRCMHMLGAPSRLSIYKLIKVDGEHKVTDVVNATELTQPTVSYHLKEMKDAGLLVSRKHGKEMYYSINDLCPSHRISCVLSKIEFPEGTANA
jgi:ArsR family transcriptional regulator, arsenate/arsenite/antimonite-responsive transcriptional repressor